MQAVSSVTECDVAILGAGVAGCAVATRLALAGWQVVIAGALPRGGTTGLHWLSAAGEQRLARLHSGVPALIESCTGFLGIWGEPGDGDALANHTAAERRVVDCASVATALQHQAHAVGARFAVGKATRVLQRESGWRVQLERPGGGWRSVQSRFVIDATGREAAVARMLGVPRVADDPLGAWSWVLQRPAGEEALMTLIESTPLGWWRSIDLANGRREVTFFSDHDLQSEQQADWDSVLQLAADAPATQQRMLDCDPPDAIHAAAAGSSALREAAGRCWLAVGDAAATFDPIVGSGLDFALVCAEVASNVVAQTLHGEPDAPLRFNQLVRGACAAHERERRARYAAETRWPQAPFWQRRAQPVPSQESQETAASGQAVMALGLACAA